MFTPPTHVKEWFMSSEECLLVLGSDIVYEMQASGHVVCFIFTAMLLVCTFIKSEPIWVCELWRRVSLMCVCMWVWYNPFCSNRSQVVCGDCKCFPMDFCGWLSLNRFWLDSITCFVIQWNNSVHIPPGLSSETAAMLLCVLVYMSSGGVANRKRLANVTQNSIFKLPFHYGCSSFSHCFIRPCIHHHMLTIP